MSSRIIHIPLSGGDRKVCGAVIYLRRSDGEVARPFRTPGARKRHRRQRAGDGGGYRHEAQIADLLGKAKSRPPGLNLVFKSGQTRKLESHYSADMPRLLPADKCPKCSGPLKRQPTLVGTIFTCEKCDADDPVKAADNWIKGELKPPE